MSPSHDETMMILGRLQADHVNMTQAIDQVRSDVTIIRDDVHELRVMMAGVQAKVDRMSQESMNLFGFAVMCGAGIAMYTKSISEFAAVTLVIVAATVMQKESIIRLVARLPGFRNSRDSSTYTTQK